MDELYHPKAVSAIFKLAQSIGMNEACSSFSAILNTEIAYDHITFSPLDGEESITFGWPGATYYRDQLRPVENKIVLMRRVFHTRSECDGAIELAKTHSWKSLLIATIPYHWPRVLSSIVGSMAMFEYRIPVYFLRPQHVDWHASMLGSQGRQMTSHFAEAGTDVFSLLNYIREGEKENGTAWKKHFGAPFREIFAYLDWRDQAPTRA